MQIVYQFKLYPNCAQSNRLFEWQKKIRSLLNICLADRIDTYQDSFVQGEFCNLKKCGVASPLACSVNRSASLGEYWKEDKPNRRRGDKSKPFNPRRSAVEIHSSFATWWRQTKPWYADVSSDVLQQSLRHQDNAFRRFFSGQSKFPKFKRNGHLTLGGRPAQACPHHDIGIEFKPGTVKIKGNRIKFPLIGWMKFAKSREIADSWEIRTVTIIKDVDCWIVSVLLRDESIPDYCKSIPQLKTVVGCDVGIKKIVATSNQEIESNPRIAQQLERRLSIRQRRLSRKKKGSLNRQKAAIAVAKVHRDVRRRRQDFQWKLGKQIKEKFVCENCGHYEDADTQAGSVLAQRGVKKLGIDTLTVVSRKVTTKPALTGSQSRKKLSPALASESGNPAKYVQLELFSNWEWKTG
jgi:putative transposase